MRFGMSGCFLPENMDDVTPEMCQRVRALGFTGIFTRFRKNDPHTTTKAQARAVARLSDDAHVGGGERHLESRQRQDDTSAAGTCGRGTGAGAATSAAAPTSHTAVSGLQGARPAREHCFSIING